MKLDICIVFTATPPIKPFCKICGLTIVDNCQKGIPCLFKFFWFQVETPDEFLPILTQIVIFTRTFSTSPTPSIEYYVLAKSTTKVFCIQIVPVLKLRDTTVIYPPKRVNISKRELSSSVNSFRGIRKTLNKASKCIRIPLPEPKNEIGSAKSKDNLFADYYKDIIEHPNRQIRLSLRFANNNSYVFSIKKMNYRAISLLLQNLSTLTIAKFNTSTRTVIT